MAHTKTAIPRLANPIHIGTRLSCPRNTHPRLPRQTLPSHDWTFQSATSPSKAAVTGLY